MGDDEDRKYLLGLTEKQREEILLERYNKRKELQARFEMKKRLKNKDKNKQEGEENNNNNNNSSSSSVMSNRGGDMSPRRAPKRSKNVVTSKDKAFHDLKKKRAKAVSGHSDNIYDDDDYDDDDDDNNKNKKYLNNENGENNKEYNNKDKENENEEDNKEGIIKHEDINKICLTRDWLERKVEEPYFDDLVIGFFARVGIGKNNEKPVYRLAQITDVKDGPKKYQLGKKYTNKLLVLKHGTTPKSFTIEYISNKPPTLSEFNKWVQEMESNSISIITTQESEEKLQLLQEAENYVKTEDDLKRMIERNKQLNKIPVNIAAEKYAIMTQLDAAKDLGNNDEINRLSSLLSQLEKLHAQQKRNDSEKAKKINERNKLTNKTVCLFIFSTQFNIKLIINSKNMKQQGHC